MSNAKIKFDDREIIIGEAITTIGRASDNTISFSEDSNISRYHAEIEKRGDDFYLLELGSSNGTTVNGGSVESEIPLSDGDTITLGNSATLEFYLETDEKKEKEEEKSESAASSNSSNLMSGGAGSSSALAGETEIAKDAQATAKFPAMLAVAAVTCGLAAVFVVGAVLFSYSGGGSGGGSSSACQAKAKIINLENFDILREPKEISVELEDEEECASRAIFLLNDKAFATSDEKPFTVTLNPNSFPTLANGENNSLKVVLEDAAGNKIIQPDEILLVFETRVVPTPTPVVTQTVETGGTPTPKPTPQTKGKVTPDEVKQMSENLAKQMGGSGYKFDKEFLEKVQAKTNEYLNAGGYSARAQGYQDKIKTAFNTNTNVGSALGFLTAMSRTRFNLPNQGAEAGLWRMSDEFAAQNSLKLGCPTEPLSDATQACAADASATYLKLLLRTIFKNDPIYTAAAYGMPVGEASDWERKLPADRSDFWKVITDANRRETLVNFFAAGIVAENPQKFGLKDDRPISSLY